MINDYVHLCFKTQSKAYAKAQGVPTTWSQEDQGYIARWYSYYNAESYETEDSRSTIRKVLLTTFILLNLSVLYITITHGEKWYCRLCDILMECSISNLSSAVGVSMAIFNFAYLTSSVVLYTGYFIYPSRTNQCIDGDSDDCSPPHTPSYKDEVTTFIVKGVVIFIAIITELLVAILISRKAIMPMGDRRSKCFQIILLWNMFVFVQIWVGLALLPACILLIIAPLQTIPILCAAIALPPWLLVVIVTLLRLGNQLQIRNWDYKINAMVCIHSSGHMIFAVLTVVLMVLYFHLSPGGTTLSSTEGIIFSLIPSVMLSMTAWGIKRRFFNSIPGKGKTTRAERSVRSVSTEQENLQGTEEDAVFTNVVESGGEQSGHLTAESQSDISAIV